jgi:SAM-dependent methyltransferase
MAAITDFLNDYEPGRRTGRYLAAMLPSLPFKRRQFDLALCSHFLFLYSHQLSLAFHLQALREMLSVAREARVFPLLDLGGDVSHHLEHVVATLEREKVQARIEPVPYEFQRGGDRMLRLCPLTA